MPKGVQLTHRNLAAQGRMLVEAYHFSPETTYVSWNPLYHDMGLTGSVVAPVSVGCHSVLMAPMAFLQRPLRWLHAISRHRAQISGGPNFAFDLCVRKATEEDLETLDLSSWTEAFNGAEPIRAETIERFASTFARCGFRREATYPCWGLAEATCVVTGSPQAERPILRTVGREALERGAASDPASDEDALTVVSSGTPLYGHEVRIADPQTGRELPDGQVGEAWVRGACVSPGYWGRPEANRETFGAMLEDGDGPFLRTGDLAFVVDEQLYIVGRAKDTIIVRGRNLAAHDLERTAELSHPAVRPGCSAAFAIERDGNEAVAIVAECTGTGDEVPAAAGAIRRAVSEEHGVVPETVVLVEPRTIPKTSSGKIQRRATRDALLDGSLAALRP
jgi:acyl-CoA synthetase (AMP-forming)/AMP-acid ligase II